MGADKKDMNSMMRIEKSRAAARLAPVAMLFCLMLVSGEPLHAGSPSGWFEDGSSDLGQALKQARDRREAFFARRERVAKAEAEREQAAGEAKERREQADEAAEATRREYVAKREDDSSRVRERERLEAQFERDRELRLKELERLGDERSTLERRLTQLLEGPGSLHPAVEYDVRSRPNPFGEKSATSP